MCGVVSDVMKYTDYEPAMLCFFLKNLFNGSVNVWIRTRTRDDEQIEEENEKASWAMLDEQVNDYIFVLYFVFFLVLILFVTHYWFSKQIRIKMEKRPPLCRGISQLHNSTLAPRRASCSLTTFPMTEQ